MNRRKVILAHTANFDPVLQKMHMDKQAGGRPTYASPQISDKRDDRDRHGGPKVPAESRMHRDLQTRDKQESSLLKEEMKRERMLITVSHEPVAMSKPVVDQVKDKTVAVESKGSKEDEDEDEDDVEEKSSKEHSKKSEAKSSKSEKKVFAKKKIHKAKKKKSKKKKDKRKS